MNTGEILIYQNTDGNIKIDVRLEDETVWLSQAQLCELFNKSKATISEHIKNVFEEGELDKKVVVRKFRTTTQHGAIAGKTQDVEVNGYNLDVIISVGYRVKSPQGTQFRIWAISVQTAAELVYRRADATFPLLGMKSFDKKAATPIKKTDVIIAKNYLNEDEIKLLGLLVEQYLAFAETMAQQIQEIKKVNRIKGIDFTKKMQALVERYNQRDENDILRSEVYEEMAEQLTNLIWDVHKEFSAGDVLGIDFEEKAFYDILKELCTKYDFTYPEDKLIELAKAVKDLVDAQAKFPDWNRRDDIKSALKVGLILLLDEFGYPPVERDEVYVEIFEQAENFKKYNRN